MEIKYFFIYIFFCFSLFSVHIRFHFSCSQHLLPFKWLSIDRPIKRYEFFYSISFSFNFVSICIDRWLLRSTIQVFFYSLLLKNEKNRKIKSTRRKNRKFFNMTFLPNVHRIDATEYVCKY